MTREQIVSSVWKDTGNGPAFQALDCDCVLKKMRIVSEIVDKVIALTNCKVDSVEMEIARIQKAIKESK